VAAISEHFAVAAVAERWQFIARQTRNRVRCVRIQLRMCEQALRVQEAALNRPRAQAATRKQRRDVQRKFSKTGLMAYCGQNREAAFYACLTGH
jgi:hypothetical protein